MREIKFIVRWLIRIGLFAFCLGFASLWVSLIYRRFMTDAARAGYYETLWNVGVSFAIVIGVIIGLLAAAFILMVAYDWARE